MVISQTTLIILLVVLAVFLIGGLATWRGGGWNVATKWIKMKVEPNPRGRERSEPARARQETGDGNISDVDVLSGGATITGSEVPIHVGHNTSHAAPPVSPSGRRNRDRGEKEAEQTDDR